MKTFKNLFLTSISIFTLLFTFSACSSDDDPQPTLSISQSNFNVESSGITETFMISSNTAWSISGYPSWVSANPTQGKNNATISLNIAENKSTQPRNCILTVKSVSGDLSQTVTIAQEGTQTELSTDLSAIELNSEAGSKQALTIQTNPVWSLSGVPDWLNASAVSGNNTSAITITAVTANESASERSATLSIKAGDAIVTVTVTQKPNLPDVRVVPYDIVTLYDQMCFEFKAFGKVHNFRYIIIEKSEIDRTTDKRIIEMLEDQEELIFSDGYIAFPSGLDNNTEYYICTLAYDQDERHGELIKTPAKTRIFKDRDEDAYATVDGYYSDNMVFFEFTKQAYCNKYHAIMGVNLPIDVAYYPSVLYAFQINYYLTHGTKHWISNNWNLTIQTNYPNNHTFVLNYDVLSPYNYVVGYAWGIDEQGTLSSDMLGVCGSIDESNANAPMQHTAARMSSPGIRYNYTTPGIEHLRKVFNK